MANGGITGMIRQLRQSALLHEGAGLSDRQLLERYLVCGEESAFEALVRRHGPMVLGVCRRILGNEADAEDAFQATFLVFFRKAASLRSRGLVGNWLYGVAYNVARKAKALGRVRQAREREAGIAPAPESREGVWQEIRGLLDAELSTLPKPYRTAVVLCDLEGKTLREAAGHLGWPQGTVATRLRRGRALLAKRLAGRGLTLSVGMVATAVSSGAAPAEVPASLIGTTVKAAGGLAAGQAVTSGLVSAPVAALTEGVLKAMFLTKLKVASLALLVVLAVAIGVGSLAHTIRAGGRPTDEPAQALPPDKEAAQDSQRLQGAWAVVSAADNGRDIPREQLKGAKLVFEKDRFRFSLSPDRVRMDATYRLDPSKHPRAVDISRPGKGTQLGIYEVKGDELRICINEQSATDGKRPTRFASEKDSANDVLIVARRDRALDARQTVTAFLAAALAGKTKEAAALGQPGQAPSRPDKVEELAPFKGQNVTITRLHADAGNALAVTSVVTLRDRRGPRKGMIQLTLVKQDGRWLVRDIDFESEESAKAELQRFLGKHPQAKPLPEKEGK